MGMSSGGDAHGSMSEINVTPFVDVMLVLLIIFVVTTPMMTQGVQIDVPDTEGAPLPASEEHLTISVPTEGNFILKNQNMLWMNSEQIRSPFVAKPDQSVCLWADAETPYQNVAEAMIACTNAGFTKSI